MLPCWANTLLLAGCLAEPGWLLAQLEVERTERLSLEQGLSDQNVRDIHCDARGFLWLATGLNLERYDGYRFEAYNEFGSTARLHGQNIAQIGESAGAYLYLRYPHLQFIDLLHTDQLDCTQVFLDARSCLQGQVKEVYMEEQGDFFALSALPGALAIWRLNNSRLFEQICVLPWENFSAETFKLVKSKAGGFWVHGCYHGLFQVSSQGEILQHFENTDFKAFPDFDRTITAPNKGKLEPAIFHEDQAGRFWLSFKNLPGVYLFQKDERSITVAQPWPGLSPQEYFTRLWEDDRRNLLFASPTPGDRFIISKLTGLRPNGEHFDGATLLAVEDKIQDIFARDFDRQIFLGTYSGVYKVFLKNHAIRQYLARTIKPGEFGAILRSITSDGQGHVFFALEERYWYRLDPRSDQLDTLVLTNARGEPIELIRSGGALDYDPAGYLWGMSCIDEPQRRYALHRYDLARRTTRTWPLIGYLTTFHRQPDGRFIFLFRSSEQEGHIGIFDPRTEQYVAYTDADGTNPFAKRLPKCIFESRVRKGLFWIGTHDGVVAVDWQRRASRVYGTGESSASLNFSRPDLLALYEDEAGTLWLGTNGGGLNTLYFEKPDSEAGFPRPMAVKVVDMLHGLSNNLVCGVLPDGQGGFILSTDLGLNYYNPGSRIVGNFYQQDGLTNNEFNRFSFFKDENERFYFGTINGLNTFQLADLRGQKPAGNIRLTRLTKYFGEAGRLEEQTAGLDALQELVVEPEVSYFQLEFMLTDYAQPEKNQFFAWLEGQEKDWSNLGHTHVLRYNRLPAGRYTLHLRGADVQGNQTEIPFSVSIRSKEFFYRTWWFLSLVGLALLTGGGAIAQRRIRRIRAEGQQRTALSARLADLESRALQAQMNPHFIFNCLNSIQSFIADGDKDNAMRYVARFAQLTRSVLHFSGKTTIGLDEEIAALDHYLELECLRTGQRVRYQLEVAPDIEPFDTELPPMLVQPFVENSFKHGKISALHILFRKIDGQLIITVQDDGVGMSGKTDKLHQSKGIAITRERLAFWNGRADAADLRISALEKGLLITMTIQLK